MELSEFELGFEVEDMRPLIEVSLTRDNSGNDLKLHNVEFRR